MLDELETKRFEVAQLPLQIRLQEFCHLLLGTKYGSWKDGTTLESLDDFNYELNLLDCVTFVELVLALSKTEPEQDFLTLLKNIHYENGTTNFISRNHFFSLDWIPNNTDIVNDITTQISRVTQTATALIDKVNWLKVTRKEDSLPEHIQTRYRPQSASLNYIETLEFLDNQFTYFKKFPEFSIVNIVRPNWDLKEKIGTNLNISHLGFVFKDHVSRTLRFYHASDQAPLQVVTVDLCEYMAKYIDSPTIRGINVLGIEPGFYNAG